MFWSLASVGSPLPQIAENLAEILAAAQQNARFISVRGRNYKLTFCEWTLWQRAGIGAEPGPDLMLWEHL